MWLPATSVDDKDITEKLRKRLKLTKIYFKNGKTEKDLDN